MDSQVISFVSGAGVALIASYLTERRERTKESRAESRDLRSASRLVTQELLDGQAAVWATFGTSTRQKLIVSFPTTAWQEHRALLSKFVDGDTWAAIYTAYQGLSNAKLFVHDPVEDDDMNQLILTSKQVAAALDHLARYADLAPDAPTLGSLPEDGNGFLAKSSP
jgi:hypothetical protein